jgi:DNA polymerase III delta prime subunit
MYLTHANIVDQSAVSYAKLLKVIAAEGLPTHGSDFLQQEVGSFGIRHARDLKERATGKPLESNARVFMIKANAFTEEAQNALLKLTEDGPDYAYFFFVTPYPAALIPTFRSRANIIAARDLIASN